MRKFYAYIRVSSLDQNENRRFVAMRELGIPAERIFMDKQSGKDFKRPQYTSICFFCDWRPGQRCEGGQKNHMKKFFQI